LKKIFKIFLYKTEERLRKKKKENGKFLIMQSTLS